MRRRPGSVLAILALTLMITCLTGSRADAQTLNERDFWSRLEQTHQRLDEALALPVNQRAPKLASVSGLWKGIDHVRLDADETVIAVDMGWLRSGLPTDTKELQALQRRIQALLDYHARNVPSKDPRGSLAALDEVLRDPRFQYPEPTPTPLPAPTPEPLPQAGGSVSVGGWQLVFVLVGVIIVAGVVFYLARTQRFQRAALEEPPEPGEDPPTSTAAHDLAAESEAARDYRSAIRYLYLASLLKLDERGLIHYDRTLTNREHVRQITGNPQLVEALQPVVNTFDRVWYGFAPVDEPHYQRFRQDVERLEQLTP